MMREVKEREGIPLNTQVIFAMRDWLEKKGYELKADRRRAPTRSRS
ncbi:MAG: hypothetical protein U0360_11730 [Dehalococcoidia bacterium]